MLMDLTYKQREEFRSRKNQLFEEDRGYSHLQSVTEIQLLRDGKL